MKTFYKILSLVAVVSLAVVSCAKKELPYEEGTPELQDSYGVYFPVQDASGSHTYDPEMDRTISITVARPADKSNGAITVPYTLKASAEDVFQGGEITFADGQTETEFEITFDNAEEGVEYNVEVFVDDPKYTFVYGSNPKSLKFSVLIVTWEYILNPKTGEPALFEFTQDFWGEKAWAYIKYYEVNGIRTCHTESNGQHFYNEPYEAAGFWGTAEDLGTDGEIYFNIYVNEKNSAGNMFVELLPTPVFINSNYPDTPVHVFDYYYFWTIYQDSLGNSQGITDDWLTFAKKQEANYPMGYYDDNGGIFFYTRSYGMYGVGGWTEDAIDIVGIGEGFTRVDYSLEVTSDYSDAGVTPILFIVGADVAKVDYAIYEGSLAPADVKKIVANISEGKEENVVSISEFQFDDADEIYYAYEGVSPEASGEYTLVAVSFNKPSGELPEPTAQASQSISFFHVTADDDEDYAVEVSVFTEDTPARYKERHSYDSFAYGVSGTELTDVHIAIYTSSTVEEYGLDAVVADAKADEEGTYAVSEDVLAQINADGGYYTLATDVKANTTYVVVAWATNGSKENYSYDVYTTDPVPYVWKNLGKGTLTDGFLLPDWSMDDATVACDVYEEETTPGLYMITGFQLELAAIFYEVEPSVLLPYEGENGNWWNAEIVVNATNPAKVSIAQQQYGIYTNGTYQYPLIWSVADGTLENGAITFPENGLVVGYTGNNKAYYANPNGTFKITLPEAAGAAPTLLPTGNVIKSSFTHAASKAYAKPVVKYERDPKAISVETKTLNYSGLERKQNDQKRGLGFATEK